MRGLNLGLLPRQRAAHGANATLEALVAEAKNLTDPSNVPAGYGLTFTRADGMVHPTTFANLGSNVPATKDMVLGGRTLRAIYFDRPSTNYFKYNYDTSLASFAPGTGALTDGGAFSLYPLSVGGDAVKVGVYTTGPTTPATFAERFAVGPSLTLALDRAPSCFIKRGNSRYATVAIVRDSTPGQLYGLTFDFDTGTIAVVHTPSGSVYYATAIPVGDGWYRIAFCNYVWGFAGAFRLYIGATNAAGTGFVANASVQFTLPVIEDGYSTTSIHVTGATETTHAASTVSLTTPARPQAATMLCLNEPAFRRLTNGGRFSQLVQWTYDKMGMDQQSYSATKLKIGGSRSGVGGVNDVATPLTPDNDPTYYNSPGNPIPFFFSWSAAAARLRTRCVYLVGEAVPAYLPFSSGNGISLGSVGGGGNTNAYGYYLFWNRELTDVEMDTICRGVGR